MDHYLHWWFAGVLLADVVWVGTAVDFCQHDWTFNISHSRCPGVFPDSSINTIEECEAACEQDCQCDAWQWCTANSCKRENDKWSGQWARCYKSGSGFSRDPCLPGKNWVGAARYTQRVPQRTQPVTRKRGLGGFLDNDAEDAAWTCEDAAALNLADSWYYTWNFRPTQGDQCRNTHNKWGDQIAAEFVPLVKSVYAAEALLSNDELLLDWKRANVHYLLGYNEPDLFLDPPENCTPAEAAKDWVYFQRLANLFDPPLELVSPAPSSDDFDEDGVSSWLDEFFVQCRDVVAECDPDSIRYIAFHDYVGDAAALERRINGMYQHYGKRIWLTEFALGRWSPSPTRDEQNQVMRALLPVLENNPAIMRYAWFSARTEPNTWGGTKDLLPYNSASTVPTSTGEIYANFWESTPEPTMVPTAPTPIPTAAPTAPTAETGAPTVPPTATPTAPTAAPTAPTLAPTAPTSSPTAPTSAPTAPAAAPTAPTESPTAPTSSPTVPTASPTAPTSAPTVPTASPTAPTPVPSAPTATPTAPTSTPTAPTPTPTAPTAVPTEPTLSPTAPTLSPTAPTSEPTAPTLSPTAPTLSPTSPTAAPTAPTLSPTEPTVAPTTPTPAPTAPTIAPTSPTLAPTAPSAAPTMAPTTSTSMPTATLTDAPTTSASAPSEPTAVPTALPTPADAQAPASAPTLLPTTVAPSAMSVETTPSAPPTLEPSTTVETNAPTTAANRSTAETPTFTPTHQETPEVRPTLRPTQAPTARATQAPTPLQAPQIEVPMTVAGIDYDVLVSNASMKAAFEDGIKGTVAKVAGGGVTKEDVELILSAGSVNVTATINVPSDGDLDAVASSLEDSSAMASAVVNTVQDMPDVEAATTGNISVAVEPIIIVTAMPTPLPTEQPTVSPTTVTPTATPTTPVTQSPSATPIVTTVETKLVNAEVSDYVEVAFIESMVETSGAAQCEPLQVQFEIMAEYELAFGTQVDVAQLTLGIAQSNMVSQDKIRVRRASDNELRVNVRILTGLREIADDVQISLANTERLTEQLQAVIDAEATFVEPSVAESPTLSLQILAELTSSSSTSPVLAPDKTDFERAYGAKSGKSVVVEFAMLDLPAWVPTKAPTPKPTLAKKTIVAVRPNFTDMDAGTSVYGAVPYILLAFIAVTLPVRPSLW